MRIVDDASRSWIRLNFDGRSRFGNHEHYFHFTWGYLLPLIDRILSIPEDAPPPGIEVQSCGPTMDPRFEDVARWVEVPLRVAQMRGETVKSEEWVARWDVWLRSRFALRVRIASALHARGLRHCVLTGIERVRAFAIARALAESTSAASTERAGREWLLLKRSEEPSFYRVGGPAAKPTYGVTRRSIANLEELGGELSRRGLPVRIYEPGRDDLAAQIRTYHDAAGVVGIRGAELANILWMRPGSGVVMLVTPVKRENNVARHIALVCGLAARPIPVESDHPVVSADALMREIDGLAG